MTDDAQTTALVPEELSFEQAFHELEETVHRLEEGDLTLDEAIGLYERGMRLARRCSDALDAAELQVEQLSVVSNQQLAMFLEAEDEHS